MNALVFGKYDTKVEVADPGLKAYINLEPRIVVHTQGRHAKKNFGRKNVHVVERLINNLMRSGTGGKIGGKLIRDRGACGKKTKVMNALMEAFEIIEKREKQNPLQVLVRAIENAAPREEVTRIRTGGVISPIAVDISPLRRLDIALRNIGLAVVIQSFNNPKSFSQAIADEIILASKNDPASYAIKRKLEIERIAKSSR